MDIMLQGPFVGWEYRALQCGEKSPHGKNQLDTCETLRQMYQEAEESEVPSKLND